MNVKTNKKPFSILMIILGAALVLTAILLGAFGMENLKAVGGVCIGLGVVLITIFGGQLFSIHAERKHPEIYRKKNIEVNDERNTTIRGKAAVKVNNIFLWMLFAAILVFILLDVELYITLVLACLIAGNGVLNAVYINHYNKQL
jgi:hypothetical protein